MNNNNNWLEISDLSEFADYLRKMVYINFSEDADESDEDIAKCFSNLKSEEKQELDKCLSIKETKFILKENTKKMRHKKTKEIKYLLNNKILNKVLENLNQRLVSNIIASLVSKGMLESAYDEEMNDFVFWVSDKYRKDEDDNSQTDKF